MNNVARRLSPGGVVLAALLLVGQLPTELPSTKFSSGQDIQPYFEGWIHNPDGTFDLVFGYFNRNWQEELAIAPGPENFVAVPGSKDADHGQPTYFLPRRQGWAYRVTVPSTFGKQEVTWTIVANGSSPCSAAMSATLRPRYCSFSGE